jgi:hypothetical protein
MQIFNVGPVELILTINHVHSFGPEGMIGPRGRLGHGFGIDQIADLARCYGYSREIAICRPKLIRGPGWMMT